MKKLTILLSLLIIVGMMTACGNASEEAPAVEQAETSSKDQTGSSSGDQGTGDFDPESSDFELAIETALILGTFRLEGTENEISAEQAQELIPLWQVYKSLLESDTAAAAEIEALTDQIADTMTDAQMDAINNLSLTMEDLRVLNEELGLDQGFQRPEGEEGDGESGFQRPEGMPEGMGPGRGQGAGGTGLSPEEMESLQATREAGGGGFGRGMGMVMNTGLIDALIELLQNK